MIPEMVLYFMEMINELEKRLVSQFCLRKEAFFR